MTERSEVDPLVLAGEPDSVHLLEGGDDDLPPGGTADGDEAGVVPDDASAGSTARDRAEWSDTDWIVEASPTALGES